MTWGKVCQDMTNLNRFANSREWPDCCWPRFLTTRRSSWCPSAASTAAFRTTKSSRVERSRFESRFWSSLCSTGNAAEQSNGLFHSAPTAGTILEGAVLIAMRAFYDLYLDCSIINFSFQNSEVPSMHLGDSISRTLIIKTGLKCKRNFCAMPPPLSSCLGATSFSRPQVSRPL